MPAALKYQRTEYAKKIRKDYEAGKIKERRCNMREYTLRTDGLCNTITTVQKDNYIAVDAADAGAEANRKIAESLTPELIEKFKYDKWNGEVSKVQGNGTSIIGITQ